MIHGTNDLTIQGVRRSSESIAQGIASTGFGTGAVLDGGYYGQGTSLCLLSVVFFCLFVGDAFHAVGMYFTRDLDYAEKYGRVFVLAAVMAGNVFPVTEHPLKDARSLKGQPCAPGYQSHYTVGKKKMMMMKGEEV